MKLLEMKKVFFLFAFSLFYVQAFGQIGGLSGSKLNAVTVDVVDNKKIEFEPGFYHFQSSGYWDNLGNSKTTDDIGDSVTKASGIWLRYTYGLWNKLEIGTTISTDLEVSSWGLRYIIYQSGKLGFALLAGINFDFGNGTFNKKVHPRNLRNSVGGGLVSSYQINPNLSLDVDAQYLKHTKKFRRNPTGSFYFDADIGQYLFNKQLQLIAGIGYSNTKYENFNNQVLTIYPGFTVETGKSYIIVFSAPFDVYGRNAFKNHGISLALTLTFE